jgi:hypothetical protein
MGIVSSLSLSLRPLAFYMRPFSRAGRSPFVSPKPKFLCMVPTKCSLIVDNADLRYWQEGHVYPSVWVGHLAVRGLFQWTRLYGCIYVSWVIESIRSDPYYAKCIDYTFGHPRLLCYPCITTDVVSALSPKGYELGHMDQVIWYRTRGINGLSGCHTSNTSIYFPFCLTQSFLVLISFCLLICSGITLSSDFK